MRARLVLVFIFALCLSGCVNHGNAPPGPPGPYPQLEVCYNSSSVPSGYIRVGSKEELRSDCPQASPGQLNVFIYTRYDNLPVGSELLVCADQTTFLPGWEDVSGGYHDANGCDASAHPDPNFANVRLIYRKS